jgi:hypothetical protein
MILRSVATQRRATEVDATERRPGSHMLSLLAIACRKRFVVDCYRDEAVGHLCFIANSVKTEVDVEMRLNAG